MARDEWLVNRRASDKSPSLALRFFLATSPPASATPRSSPYRPARRRTRLDWG